MNTTTNTYASVFVVTINTNKGLTKITLVNKNFKTNVFRLLKLYLNSLFFNPNKSIFYIFFERGYLHG